MATHSLAAVDIEAAVALYIHQVVGQAPDPELTFCVDTTREVQTPR